jgi:hypothetical protein
MVIYHRSSEGHSLRLLHLPCLSNRGFVGKLSPSWSPCPTGTENHDPCQRRRKSRNKKPREDVMVELTEPPPHVLAHHAFPVFSTTAQPPEVALLTNPTPFRIPISPCSSFSAGYVLNSERTMRENSKSRDYCDLDTDRLRTSSRTNYACGLELPVHAPSSL